MTEEEKKGDELPPRPATDAADGGKPSLPTEAEKLGGEQPFSAHRQAHSSEPPGQLSRPAAPAGTPPEALGAGRPGPFPTAAAGHLALQSRPATAVARRRALAILSTRWAPLLALCLLLAFSVASKAVDISQPCESPCKASSKHTLIFDESYYVNAARVIDGIEPPVGDPYHGDPKGEDPNAEHPQLAKLVIAAGIEIFGDNPIGWRLGSIIFAVIALLALYGLVRAAGGGRWLSVGVVAVASLDNLMLVHGRIATLDIYAVAMMLVSALLYMRKRPLLAGLALGIAACMKEVALFLAIVFVLLEALQIAQTWAARRHLLKAGLGEPEERGAEPQGAEEAKGERAAQHENESPPRAGGARNTPEDERRDAVPSSGSGEIRYGSWRRRNELVSIALQRAPRLIVFLLTGALSTLGLLWLLDVLVPAYNPGTHQVYSGNPFAHLAHMYEYALLLKAKPNETGITSSPLAWLLDEKAINYAKVAVNTSVAGKIIASKVTISFQGLINPFIIFLAIPGVFTALAAAWRKGDELAGLGACWCLGTYLPFLIGDLSSGRVSYIYYMLIVMPGVYIVTTRLFASRRLPTAAALGWALALIYGFIHLYPIRTLL